jgi:hypothetical protein
MRTKQLIIIALALGLPAASLLAQDDGPPQGSPPQGGQYDGPPGGPPVGQGQGRRRRPPPLPIMTALDANHDGTLSAAEIANAPAALKTLDKNGDGQLTPDEYMPARPPRNNSGAQQDGPPPSAGGSNQQGQGRPRRPVPPIVAALDTNGDGIISADEIANASASLLKLDKNGDGKLTPDELRPQRPPPPPDGEGQNGPDNGPPPPNGGGPGGSGDGGPPPPPPDQNN